VTIDARAATVVELALAEDRSDGSPAGNDTFRGPISLSVE